MKDEGPTSCKELVTAAGDVDCKKTPHLLLCLFPTPQLSDTMRRDDVGGKGYLQRRCKGVLVKSVFWKYLKKKNKKTRSITVFYLCRYLYTFFSPLNLWVFAPAKDNAFKSGSDAAALRPIYYIVPIWNGRVGAMGIMRGGGSVKFWICILR